jgi:lysozyme
VTFSQDCMDLVKLSEGCELNAYDDIAGIPTIGYGHTGLDVHLGLTWTQARADAQLACDLEIAAECVHALVKVPLTQGQFDALTDFVFNLGRGQLKRSTLLRRLNMGKYDVIPDELNRWTLAAGVPQPGLIRRRNAEAALWNKKEEA